MGDIKARLAGDAAVNGGVNSQRFTFVLKISANIIEADQVDIKKPTYRDRPTDKTLSFSWSWRPKSLQQFDDGIRLTTRSRDVRVVRGFILGLAIKVFREDPERWISYSRNKNWYRWAVRSRYWPVRNMYASMISAVDQLAAADLIENHIVPPGNLGEQSRFRATPELMALVEESRISLVLDRPEIIILRDAEKRPIFYRETRETERMRRALEEYNRSAASVDVRVAGQKIIEGDPLVVGESRTGAATLQAYRLFNESFRLGGRFYGQSTQNIPKELRATITINDSATDEPDFPSLHPQLLYALVGRHLPHDPYDLDGWDRPTVKRAFNTMLNANTPNLAMLAVAETMGGYFTRHREQAKRLIAEIERKHAPVAEHFGSGIGLRLQRTDSDIAARVLAKSGKDGEFLLLLHDGFRSRLQYADRTREIMDECYEKVVGKSPAISTLKRKTDLQIWSPVVMAVERASGRAGERVTARAGERAGELVAAWVPGPLLLPISAVLSLPLALASLVVVCAFYSGSVVGAERAA